MADTLKLNLLELGKNGSNLSVIGKTDNSCPTVETHDTVTFTTRESHSVSMVLFLGNMLSAFVPF